MKTINRTAFILICLFFANVSFCQIGYNTILLANLNQHPNATNYSACWGYVAPNGREYAILGCPEGTSFIDITDSLNIHEADFEPGVLTGWREMKTFSHYAYVVTDVASGSQGVQIIDLQYLPDSVHFVRYYAFSGFTKGHTISQSGPYLYVNGGNYLNAGIFVLDLSQDPEMPVRRGQWESQYVHDCRVVNDTIWACNIYNPPGTVTVINAVNKDSLQTVTSWQNLPNPGPHNCALTTDRAYCLVTDEIGGTPRLLKIWDVRNLSNITLAATWQPTAISDAIVHNVEVYGNLAVIAHYTAGIRIVDITNPASPQEIAWYDTSPAVGGQFVGCWGVYMFPSGKIIGSDMQLGLFVVKMLILINGNGNNSQPQSFDLKQNYPNPFNAITNFKFQISKLGYVLITVYDITGKAVNTLVNAELQPGSYEFRWNAANLPSGIYFYQLKTGDFLETKKMILLK